MSQVLYTFPGDARPALSEVGGKGLSLFEGTRASLPIPPGFILTTSFFDHWFLLLRQTTEWRHFLSVSDAGLQNAADALKKASLSFRLTDDQKSRLAQALQLFVKDDLFAVRSSSPHEDLEGASFAGGYETVLGVTHDGIEDAIRRCFASCLDYRVFVYLRETGFDIQDPKIAVIIQKQIASEVSGVGFSINPVTNNYDEAVFNSNWGLGETVVAGIVTPDTFIVDKVRESITDSTLGRKELSIWLKEDGGTEERISYRYSDLSLTDARVLELTKLIKNVELHYKGFMDIEWAFAAGTLYLLQARPITAYVPLSPDMITRPGEKKRLYFDVSITAEGMTRPISKMGTSLFKSHLARVIGQMIWMRDIRRNINTAIPWISEGRIFANISNGLAIAGKKKVADLMKNMDSLAAETIENLNEGDYISSTWRVRLLPLGLVWKLPGILFFIRNAKKNPAKTYARVQTSIQKFEQELRRVSGDEVPLHSLWKEFYKMFSDVFLWTVPLAVASRYSIARLKEIGGTDPRMAKLEIALDHNVTTQMGLALGDIAALMPDRITVKELQEKVVARDLPAECLKAWDAFLDTYGDRGSDEIDVAAARYRDKPAMLVEIIHSMCNSTAELPRTVFERNKHERQEAYTSLYEGLKKKDMRVAEEFAREYCFFETFGGLRETHKYYLIRIVGTIREKILKEARALFEAKRLDTVEQVFDLTLDQLEVSKSNTSLDLRKLAQVNTIFLKKLARVVRPPTLIDSRGFIPRPPARQIREGEHAGLGVSSGVVRGRVKVLHTPDEKRLEKGEILVARATDPGWTPLFVNAGGVILEIGGLLQHGALVAREYGLPCVAGIDNATTLWKDGTLVEVDGSSGMVRLVQE